MRHSVQDLNPKELYLELMPFLEKNTGLFMKVMIDMRVMDVPG